MLYRINKSWLMVIVLLVAANTCYEVSQHSALKDETIPGPKGYVDYFKMRRAGMKDMVAVHQGGQEAQSMYRKQQKHLLKDGGLKSWTWRGPGNIGGRVRALAVKDNGSGEDELFAGSSGGGMLHSTNAGASWTYIDDFLPSLIVTSIIIDPNDDDRMYAATGDGFGGSTSRPGAGIFFSSDGGDNWFVLPATQQYHFINRIAMNPDDSSELFAVITAEDFNLNPLPAGTILRSTNGGYSWDEVQTTFDQALDIEYNPHNTAELLVGTNNGAYRSVIDDDELDFVVIPGLSGLGRVEIAYTPTLSDLVYALTENSDGVLYRSLDGGMSWSIRHSGTDMGPAMWHYNSLFIDPNIGSNILAGGQDVYRSTDVGLSFTTISDWQDYHNGSSAHADQHIFVPSINYSSETPIVYVGNDGGVQRIDDIWTEGKNDWHNLAGTTFGVTQFYGADAKKDGSLFIGGTQDNSFCFGSNASDWVQPVTGDGAQAEINYMNEDIMYANLNNHKIRKTTDGGQTWEIVANFETTEFCNNNPDNACCQEDGSGQDGTACIDANDVIRIADNAPLIGEFIMDPDDPEILYIGATNLWRLDDDPFGRSVTLLTGASGFVTTIAAADNGQTIWAGFSQQILRASFNGGATFLAFEDLFTLSLVPFTDVAIDPINSDRILVSMGGYTQENLFLIDVINNDPNQSTATNISLPFPMQVNTVAFHPTKSGWLYIGTDVGIFASEDDGQNWSVTPIFDNKNVAYPNEGPIYSIVEELFWYGDGSSQYPYHLAAATFGRGIWSSTHPVLSHLYIDKNYTGTENGTFNNPYNSLEEVLDVAGPGSTIVFKSSGSHDENGTPLILSKRTSISVTGGSVVIE